jgi:hypothetical protein
MPLIGLKRGMHLAFDMLTFRWPEEEEEEEEVEEAKDEIVIDGEVIVLDP